MSGKEEKVVKEWESVWREERVRERVKVSEKWLEGCGRVGKGKGSEKKEKSVKRKRKRVGG